ncbi:GNAT family N-acetyltransferase [Vreelandella sp. EE27]
MIERPANASAPFSKRCAQVVAAHAKRLKRRRWRQLVWLHGEAGACREAALALWQAHAWQAPLWVASPEDAPVAALSNKKARSRLGGEHQLVVIDASAAQGFDPDALGVLAGTLTAGGLCVLITPADWGRAPDPDYARFTDHPWHWQGLSAYYLQRLAGILTASADVVRWPVALRPWLPRLGPVPPAPHYVEDPACQTPDQARVASLITRLKRRRPLVITADRGRGKSAALGIACARLLQSGVSDIVVTAPSLGAIVSLTERLGALCPAGRWQGPGHFELPSGQTLRYLTPQALGEQVSDGVLGGDGRYLLVDEAAAIPAALLAQWLEAFPRIAFATTVHGYEGSGRGFALRFREVLERQTPLWREVCLDAPVRWAAQDPLEAVLKKLLLLDAPLPRLQRGAPDATQALTQPMLSRDPVLMETLFGLLVQSHYRTTPNDLRQLMDGPGTGFRMMGEGAAPQAVLVTREEGGFEAELADQVARGERRPRGHLLAQSLAAHSGSRDALIARWRRVARIATHPQRRREGLGRALIEADIAAARESGLALFGATFGAEASLLRFWRALGFKPVRLGVTREASTGEYAVMVARALNPEGEAVLKELDASFSAGLESLLAFELPKLAPDVVVLLLGALKPAPLNAQQRQDVRDVAYAHRDPALARPALALLARLASAEQAKPGAPSDAAHALETLTAWAFQNRLPAPAPREANRALRAAVRCLAEWALFPDERER